MITARVAAPAIALSAVGFFKLYRPWQLRWGATDREVEAPMPGDGIVRSPVFNATRAVTVDVAPEAVWPWIVQIGFGRAGWYSYDALDNLGHHSSDRIVPELQHVQVGDLVPLGPGEDAGMRIIDFAPNRWVLWGEKHQLTTWSWLLEPTTHQTTRMITRVRAQPSWRHPSTAAWLMLDEIADFPMMRKCLLGIKERAEKQGPDVVALGAGGIL
jgi:hypothetical protein